MTENSNSIHLVKVGGVVDGQSSYVHSLFQTVRHCLRASFLHFITSWVPWLCVSVAPLRILDHSKLMFKQLSIIECSGNRPSHIHKFEGSSLCCPAYTDVMSICAELPNTVHTINQLLVAMECISKSCVKTISTQYTLQTARLT